MGRGRHYVLTDRHKMVATRLAMGDTTREAAQHTGYSEVRVHRIKKFPAFQAEVERERERIREEMTSEGLALLRKEMRPTIRRLVALRDQDLKLAVAARAADSILDRVIPRQEHKQEDKTLRIVLDVQALSEMRDAVVAAGIEDAEILSLPP